MAESHCTSTELGSPSEARPPVSRADSKRPLYALIGFVYAFIPQVLAFTMVGGGHGWCTPFFVSFAGFLIGPLIGMAYECQNRTTVRRLAFVALALVIGSDVGLLLLTQSGGGQYFWRVFNAGGLANVLLWGASWSILNLLPITILVGAGSLAGPPPNKSLNLRLRGFA